MDIPTACTNLSSAWGAYATAAAFYAALVAQGSPQPQTQQALDTATARLNDFCTAYGSLKKLCDPFCP